LSVSDLVAAVEVVTTEQTKVKDKVAEAVEEAH
jgi:hypothetical protein